MPERWLNGDGVLCERFFFLIKDFSRLFCFESHLSMLFHEGFFVEGSILAQDERWRRA